MLETIKGMQVKAIKTEVDYNGALKRLEKY